MLKFLMLKPFYFYFGLYLAFFLFLIAVDTATIFTVGILLCLIVLMIYTYRKRKYYDEIKTWIPIEANLAFVNAEKGMCHFKENIRCPYHGYKIDIRYRYAFHHETYEGDRYTLHECIGLFPKKQAMDICTELQKTSSFTVYINPQKPDESIVVKSVPKICYPSYLFVLLVYGSVFYLLWWKIIGH